MMNLRKTRERRQRRKSERQKRGSLRENIPADKTPGVFSDASLWISRKK